MPGREEFKREYLESIAETCSKPFAECSRMERYTALAAMIRECCSGVRAETLRRRAAAGEKIVYYFSMEFLVGRLLENYLIQLGIRDMTADILAELGEDLDALREMLSARDEIVLREGSEDQTDFLMYNFVEEDCSGCATLLGDRVLNLLFIPQSDADNMLIAATVMESYEAVGE